MLLFHLNVLVQPSFCLAVLHNLRLNRHTLANTSDVFQLVLVIILQLMPAPGVK